MLSALSPKDQKYTTDYVRECPYETTLKSLVTEFSLKKDKAMMKGIVVFCKRRLAFFKENGNKVNDSNNNGASPPANAFHFPFLPLIIY